MKTTSAVVGNFFTGMLGRLIGSLGPILLVPLMARAWSLEIYGEWLLLTAIPSYIMLSPDFGVTGAVVNEMAVLTAREKLYKAVLLYRTAWVLLSLSASLFFLLGAGIAWFVDWSRIGVLSLPANTSAGIIICACAQALIMQQMGLLGGIYKSARQNPRAGLVYSGGTSFLLAVGVVSLLVFKDPFLYSLLQVLASFIFLLAVLIDARRIMPQFSLGTRGVSLKRIIPYITPGLGHAAMPLIHALQNQGVLIVLGIVTGPTSVALFQTTRVLSNGLKSVLGLANSAVMVEIPSLLGQSKKDVVQRLLVRNTQVGIVLSSVGIAMMLLFGEAIYHAWLGDETVYPKAIALLLFISIIPFSIGSSFTILLLSANQIHRAIPAALISTLISVGLVFVCSSMGGLLGTGSAIVCWEIGISVIFIFYAIKRLDWSIFQYVSMMFSTRGVVDDLLKARNQIFQRGSL